MVCSCVACYNVRTGDKIVGFHRFPHSRPDILEKWIQAMCRKNWRPTKSNRLCSAHFTEDCFLSRVIGERKKLKEDAVPSLFDYGFYYVENNKPEKIKKCYRPTERKKRVLKKLVSPLYPHPIDRKIEEMLAFIEEFRKYPVLWRTGDRNYINREMKRAALENLGKKYGLAPDIVLNKIKNLRSSFRREHNKVMKSKNESPEDIYRSCWFGYKALLFIVDGNDAIKETDTMATFDESLVLKQRESLNCDTQNQKLHENDQQTPLSSLNCVSQNQKLHEKNQQIPLLSQNCDSQNQRLHERDQQTPLSSLNCVSQNQRLHEKNQQIPLLPLNCDSQNQGLHERNQRISLSSLNCDSQNQKLNELDQQTPSLNCDIIFCEEKCRSLSYSNQIKKTYSRYRGNNYKPWTDHNYFQPHKNDLQKKSLDYDGVTSQNQQSLSSSSPNYKITLSKKENVSESCSYLHRRTYPHSKGNNHPRTNDIYLGKDTQHDENVIFQAATLAESDAALDNIESEVMDVEPDNIPDPIACTTEYNPYLSYIADDLQDPLACDFTGLEIKQEIKEEPPDDNVPATEGISLDMFTTELDEQVIQFRSVRSTEFPRVEELIDGGIKPEIFDYSEVSRIQGIINGAGLAIKSEVFDCTGFTRNSGGIRGEVAGSPGVIDIFHT